MSSGISLDVVIPPLLETNEFSVREGYLVVDHVTLIKFSLYRKDIARIFRGFSVAYVPSLVSLWTSTLD